MLVSARVTYFAQFLPHFADATEEISQDVRLLLQATAQ
jgi:hypothetical protein